MRKSLRFYVIYIGWQLFCIAMLVVSCCQHNMDPYMWSTAWLVVVSVVEVVGSGVNDG